MSSDVPMSPGPHSRSLVHRRRTGLVFLGLTLVFAVKVFVFTSESPDAQLARARSLFGKGEFAAAEGLAQAAFERRPELTDAALLAADCALSRNAPERAVDHLARVAHISSAAVAANLLLATIHRHRLHRFDDAEAAYRAVLDIHPEHAEGNLGLARLLGLCGRRREAIPHVLRGIRAGRIDDLLILLARNDGRIHQPEDLHQARGDHPDDRNPALGEAASLMADNRVDEGVTVLRVLTSRHPDFVPARVLYGQSLLRAGLDADLADWASRLPEGARDFPETWQILAELAEKRRDRGGAIRCLWEALRINPEDRAGLFRLTRWLADAPSPKVACAGATLIERLTDRFRQIQSLEEAQTQVLFSDHARPRDAVLELAERYRAVGRLWECLGWLTIARDAQPLPPDWERQRQTLLAQMPTWPLELTIPSENPTRHCDLSDHPVPDFSRSEPAGFNANADALREVTFQDDAERTGLVFRFVNGTLGRPTRRMYEFTGGGIGVLDYDRDGSPDLFLTQGRLWSPDTREDGRTDRLFRNLEGRSFSDVSASGGLMEFGFGQGVARGDVNGDGFAEVYVANIGTNTLWFNNGDGTFTDVTPECGLEGEAWTTSCVMADLNRDGLPDLFDVNYVQGADVFERLCRRVDGSPGMCLPSDFEGAPDRLWINDGAGRFVPAANLPLDDPPGKGLGALVWNPGENGRLGLLVANDTTPNQFYVLDPEQETFQMPDRAFESGLALNAEGKATGSMGVAAGDFNDDGLPDLHVTNFLGEASALFVSHGDETFSDQSRGLRLGGPTAESLGFGTQFLDADLDGRLELFLANGHIDDLERFGRPYRQRPQLFRWDGRASFVAEDPPRCGPYFEGRWLGRGCARGDWNGDGLPDLVVGHLDDPYALLTNRSPEPGNGLTLQLFGKAADRDAVGTIVSASAGSRTMSQQLTAGDGYQCANERTIIMGFGDARRVDELSVRWASGSLQSFRDIALPARLLLVEGGTLHAAP